MKPTHPFWAEFSWGKLLQALDKAVIIGATVAPVIVQITNPAAATTAQQLSAVAGSIAQQLSGQAQ